MSTLQYYRLALLQQLKYQINLQQLISLQAEVTQLQERVALHQKKHRRCDKDIQKDEQCPLCQRKYGSEVALKLHIKLKHSDSKSRSEKDSAGGEEQLLGDEDKENIRRN